MLAEDLAQEAREAALRRLREAPVCPDSHLVVKAKDAIHKYRRRGSSVDGKLYAEGRPMHYQVASLQEPIRDTGDLREGIAGDPRQGLRPTEAHAELSTLFDQFRQNLAQGEREVLELRLTETSWDEIETELSQNRREVDRSRQAMEDKALAIWEKPEDVYYSDYYQREKQPYSREADLPEQIPAELLEVLTEQESVALAAYRYGATQEDAGQESGLSQATVSRLIAFIWDNHDKPPGLISARTSRYKNDNRREMVLALFQGRPAGTLVTDEELLDLFSDVQQPVATMRRTLSRYSSQLEGARIVFRSGEGYMLVATASPDQV